jgi:aspartyl protease family protein
MRFRLIGIGVLLGSLLSPPAVFAASAIPLGEHDGIYIVSGEVNRTMALQFLIDTGSSVVVIPTSVFQALVRNGTVTDDDIVGTGTAMLADRSLYESVQVRLHEVRVGDVIVRDVVAAVSPALIAPLLGQSFLSRFAAVTFDNQRHVMILSGGAPAPYRQPYPPYGSSRQR